MPDEKFQTNSSEEISEHSEVNYFPDADKTNTDQQDGKKASAAEPETAKQMPREDTSSSQVQQASIQEEAAAALAPIKSVNTPGVLVLQWLTYAFWGWTLVALYWLAGLSVQYFVQKASSSSNDYSASYMNTMLAYSLAAVIVLFIISIICDIIYSRFEPSHKSGAAMVIMIIHAVIFALCGIGSLIVAVFAIVNMLISGGGEGATTALVTAGIMTLLYGATLVRTLHPIKIKHVTKIYWVAMFVASVSIACLGIIGPAAYALQTKDDRNVEESLPDLSYAINEYVRANNELPKSLSDSRLDSYYASYQSDSSYSAQQLVNDHRVKYTPGEQLNAEAVSTKNDTSAGYSVTELNLGNSSSKQDPVFHYQLCVTYDAKKGSGSYTYHDSYSTSKYATSPDTSDHQAGEVCYDLQTDYLY